MSDAEATIRSAIINGYTSATRQPFQDEARVDAILKSLFQSSVKWAIEDYMKEIEK